MTINYDPNTPTKQLSFADWQVQFIQNFTQLADAFSQDHVPLNDANIANRGNHTIVELVEQTTDGQTSANEFSIYAKDAEGQTDQIFFTYPGNSPVIQFTNYQIYSVTPTDKQTTYFTFLPGRILIYFGTFGPFFGPFGTPFVINLNPPVAKNIISVQFTLSGDKPDFEPSYTVSNFYNSEFKLDEVIKNINVIPNFPQTTAQAVFYMVITNI